VRYQIDPVARTTRQLQSYDGGATPFFSGQFGDADPLPTTGNLLVVDGAKPVTPTSAVQYGRVFELSSDLQEKVFEVIVNDPALPGTNPYNWNLYRAQRYRKLYAFQ
jgi:hypothetical protein